MTCVLQPDGSEPLRPEDVTGWGGRKDDDMIEHSMEDGSAVLDGEDGPSWSNRPAGLGQRAKDFHTAQPLHLGVGLLGLAVERPLQREPLGPPEFASGPDLGQLAEPVLDGGGSVCGSFQRTLLKVLGPRIADGQEELGGGETRQHEISDCIVGMIGGHGGTRATTVGGLGHT